MKSIPTQQIDIGSMVRTYMSERGIKTSWLATQIHTDRSNCYKLLKKKSMDIYTLIDISKILQHNFIKDIAGMIEENHIPAK